MMDPQLTEGIEAFKVAISSAHWRMNLDDFCTALEWRNDVYAQEKFIQFTALVEMLDKFDSNSLAQIVTYDRKRAAK